MLTVMESLLVAFEAACELHVADTYPTLFFPVRCAGDGSNSRLNGEKAVEALCFAAGR